MSDALLNRTIFAQTAIAKALAPDNICEGDWVDVYKERWPESYHRLERSRAVRKDVSNIDTEDLGTATEPEVAVQEIVIKTSAAGELLLMAWRVNFRENFSGAPAGLSVGWRSEFNPFPVTRSTLNPEHLDRTGLGGISVWTRPSLLTVNAPRRFQRALEESCSRDIDFAMFDPGNDGVAGETPASINHDVEKIPADANPLTAFKDLFQNFNGNLDTTVVVMSAERAARLNMRDETAFADLGVRGGTLAGMPVAISQNQATDSTGDYVTLVDASRIAIAYDGLEVSRSTETSIEMRDDYDSAAGTEWISIWQADAVALKVMQNINWKLLDTSCCRVLTGADW